ncbi:MAG: cation diffusion facilitator family transporter [Prochlorotrichaceae cyanobacterium]|jgi:cation diffusion facilitator family transporter
MDHHSALPSPSSRETLPGHLAPDYRQKVREVLVLTLILNIAVVCLKFIVGVWTGSLSLMADALHSVTDSLNNVLGLLTNQLSSPTPDRDHPYGHQKFEAVGALGIAALLGTACFEILQGAVNRLLHGSAGVELEALDLWIMILVLGVNIFVAFYERSVGRRIGSPILVADAYHTMSDIWITLAVILGLMGVWLLGYQWIDLILTLPVALLVLWSSWCVLRDNLPWLVDEIAIAPEAIHQVVMKVPGVLNCHSIASRGLLGRQIFIDMHVVVDAEDLHTAHNITETIEMHLEQHYAPVRSTIHIEPPGYQEEEITYSVQE